MPRSSYRAFFRAAVSLLAVSVMALTEGSSRGCGCALIFISFCSTYRSMMAAR